MSIRIQPEVTNNMKPNDPPGYAEALDKYQTSDVAREIPNRDKISLQGMFKYLKHGDCKDEEPAWYRDPEGHEKWTAHSQWNGKDSWEVKRKFVKEWKEVRNEYLAASRRLEIDHRVQVLKSLYVNQGDKRQVLENWRGTVVAIDKSKNALISFDQPPVERYVLAAHVKKYLKILKVRSNNSEGGYIVDYDELNVVSTLDKSQSEILGTLPRGKHIDVVEVVKQDTKLRGRIEEAPGPGWVTLANLHTGKRWAVVPDAEAITGVYRNKIRQDVYAGVENDSKHLHKLDAGMSVNVAHVVQTQNGKAVRGRITSPYTGWITLTWEGVDFAEFLPEPDGDDDDADTANVADTVTIESREKFGNVDDYVSHLERQVKGVTVEHKQLVHEMKKIRRQGSKAQAAGGEDNDA